MKTLQNRGKVQRLSQQSASHDAPLPEPIEVQRAAGSMWGEHLGASPVGYAEDVGDGESLDRG